MSDASQLTKSLRERLGAEDRLGKALSELLESPLLTGAIGRAFDAREKAVQAQEVAMGALNLPSAADIERLTRRLRSVSLRLEGIEEGVERLDRMRIPGDAPAPAIAERLSAIEDQLQRLTDKLDRQAKPAARPGARKAAAKPATRKAAAKPGVSKAAAKPAIRKAAAKARARKA
jgi:hypothetical protein